MGKRMKKNLISRMSNRILEGQIKAQESKGENGDEKYLKDLKEELLKRSD